MYCSENIYKGLPERDLWQLLLLGHYARRKLEDKYDDKSKRYALHAGNFCGDGRRIPTVRKFLQEKGLIVTSWNTNSELEPVDEACEALLSGFTKEPKFNTSGYIVEKKYSYSDEVMTKPVTDLSEVYKDVDKLDAYEYIYVYLNQDLYDFKVFTTIHNVNGGRRNGFSDRKYETYDLKLYPVSALNSMDDLAYIANSETYALSHAREILTAAFDLKFRAVKDDKEFLTLKDVTKRIWDVEDKMRLLRRTLKELRVLQRKVGALGDEALRKKVMSTSTAYIKRKAPLWINSKDDLQKELSLLVCKGTPLTLDRTA
jgi:hypothetical protein